MTSWTARMKSRMGEMELTQEILAKKLGITRAAITHYVAGRRTPSLRQFQKLAAILKVDPAWLQFGVISNKENKKLITENEKKEPKQNRIPLASWEQVAEYKNATKLRNEVKDFIPNFYTDQSNWYALCIKGDAMTAALGQKHSFHEGDIIIIDPEKKATHGSFVVAILPRSKEATFKQYVIDGGVRYLKPLNPQYPITKIDDSTHICGVAVRYVGQF